MIMSRKLKINSPHTVIVSDRDYPRVSCYHWWVVCEDKSRPRRTIYAMSIINGRYTYLHRFLTNAHAGQEVNHKDGNGLNCCRRNMELCEPKHNRWAFQRKNPNSTSRFRGVSYDKITGRWIAQICKNRRAIRIGRFDSEEQAAIARDEMAKKLFGRFAQLNFSKIKT